MELTVGGSGPRACVPVSLEAEYLSALDTAPPPPWGPVGTSCAGAAGRAALLGLGSGKHSSVGSAAWEPDPQVRGRGVLLTLGSRISGQL